MQPESDIIDYFKQHIIEKNRDKYFQTVKQTLVQQNPSLSNQPISNEDGTREPTQLQRLIEQYDDNYRKFRWTDSLASLAKSSPLLQESLNSVHPGLKSSKNCKFVMAVIGKLFIQELIEEMVQIAQQQNQIKKVQPNPTLTNGNHSSKEMIITEEMQQKRTRKEYEFDPDTVDQAYRRLLAKKGRKV